MAEATARRIGVTLESTWGALAVLIPTLVTAAVPTQALDLAYQLRAGAEMIASHEVMRVDVFTFTVYGEPWLNQQWGAQILLAATHPGDGWLGLGFLRVLTVAVAMFLVYRSCRVMGLGARAGTGATIAGWLVGAVTLAQLRPQSLAIVLFALTGWLISTRGDQPHRLWFVPLVALAWVNVHGSFPLVFAWLGIAAADDLLGGRRGELGRIGCVAAASALAVLVNPYGTGVLSYLVDLATDPVVSERIGEWGTPSLRSVTGSLFWVSLLGVSLVAVRRRARLSAGSFVGLIAFGLLSIATVRGVVWWALAAPILLAPALGAPDRPADADVDPGRSPIGVVIVAVLAALTVWMVGRGARIDPGTGAPAMLTFAPGHLVAALQETQAPGSRVFASQVLASWAEYAAAEYRYAVDSRIELFPDDVWDEYFTVSEGRPGWDTALDRARVDAVLLDPSQAAGLLPRIRVDPDWRLVIEGDDGSVFVREPPIVAYGLERAAADEAGSDHDT